jgi:lysophospholipase L1-like esterase
MSCDTITVSKPLTYAVIGDSHVELGNYEGFDNYGICGNTSEMVLQRLHEVSNYDVILVVVGINDFWNSEIDTLHNYDLIADKLKNKRLIFVTVPPLAKNNGIVLIMNTKVIMCNNYIRSKFDYIDLYCAVVLPDGWLNESYSKDGLHINDAK